MMSLLLTVTYSCSDILSNDMTDEMTNDVSTVDCHLLVTLSQVAAITIPATFDAKH